MMLIITIVHCGISAQVKYLKVNENTYVFDNSRNVVYNKNKKVINQQDVVTVGFEVDRNTIVRDTFREVLTPQRLKGLKGEKMAITFECDNKGIVYNVKFVFTKEPFLTPLEIYNLESRFLSRKFSIKSNLKDGVVTRFSMPCFFSKWIE